LLNLPSGEPRKQKTQVRIRKIRIPKFSENVKVPVGQGAVTKAVKDSKNKPGRGCQQNADKIKQPGTFPDPSQQVEDHQRAVKNREKKVKKSHHPQVNQKGLKETIPRKYMRWFLP
jgi:hypothetical protein